MKFSIKLDEGTADVPKLVKQAMVDVNNGLVKLSFPDVKKFVGYKGKIETELEETLKQLKVAAERVEKFNKMLQDEYK